MQFHRMTAFWLITLKPEFCQYVIGSQISTILVSAQFFKKSQNSILGPFWALLAQIWAKNEFQLSIPIIYYRAKSQKKLSSHSWEKCGTDGQTDRQTNRQQWFYRALWRIGAHNCSKNTAEKYTSRGSIFSNVTGWNVSEVSVHLKKMPNSITQVLQTYSEICNFRVIQYKNFQKQSRCS